MQNDLEHAIDVALHAHEGQIDKVGLPYILHPLAVMGMGTTEQERIVGVLHDTVEDTSLALMTIENRFGEEIADAVDSVTKRDGETYRQFVERAARNPIGRVVKMNDMRHNMSREHPDAKWKASMNERYMKGLRFLRTGSWK